MSEETWKRAYFRELAVLYRISVERDEYCNMEKVFHNRALKAEAARDRLRGYLSRLIDLNDWKECLFFQEKHQQQHLPPYYGKGCPDIYKNRPVESWCVSCIARHALEDEDD